MGIESREFGTSQESSVVFTNEPRLLRHEGHDETNKTRAMLVPHVRDYIATHERFANHPVRITFAEKGVSSLVSILETSEQKVVLKIALDSRTSNEAKFLREWENKGVAVPHVLENGMINSREYMLMSYVDAKTLNESHSYHELIKTKKFIEMGSILRQMHEATNIGYGDMNENGPEFATFEKWLNGDYTKRKISYVRNHELLTDEHGSIQQAQDILIAHVGENPKSSYCHNDYCVENMFDTTPLTVFDPNPSLNNGYMDLARSIVIQMARGGERRDAVDQFIQGYFGEEHFDKNVLHAAIVLNSHIKIAYWHKVGKDSSINNLRRYLGEASR